MSQSRIDSLELVQVNLTADTAGPADEGEEDDDNGDRRYEADDDGKGFPGFI
jgi:hypothetical protein